MITLSHASLLEADNHRSFAVINLFEHLMVLKLMFPIFYQKNTKNLCRHKISKPTIFSFQNW